MGFPVGCTEVFFPNVFLHTLSLLGFIRSLIISLFHFVGLSDFLETDAGWYDSARGQHYGPLESSLPPASVLLIREFLPVIKFEDFVGDQPPPESCAVCLYEFEGSDEVRCLTNCKHIFHRTCLDRWLDHDQKTCPLCRTAFVPEEANDQFNQRLWAAEAELHPDFYSEYTSV